MSTDAAVMLTMSRGLNMIWVILGRGADLGSRHEDGVELSSSENREPVVEFDSSAHIRKAQSQYVVICARRIKSDDDRQAKLHLLAEVIISVPLDLQAGQQHGRWCLHEEVSGVM